MKTTKSRIIFFAITLTCSLLLGLCVKGALFYIGGIPLAIGITNTISTD